MADVDLDVDSLAPGSGYRSAGNSYGYTGLKINYGHDGQTGMKIDPANIPSTADVPTTVAQKAQLLLQQSQVASAFGALEKADARMDRNPASAKAQAFAGNRQVTFDQVALGALENNDRDAAQVIGLLNTAAGTLAENQAKPIIPRFSVLGA